MYIIIPTLLVAIVSFVGGVYFEKSNSIAKVRPIKRVMSRLNSERTITINRSNK
mgnify:CR=1 FL=1